MSFESIAQSDKNAVLNIVIAIDGIYFANRQPDSGLVVDSDKVGKIRQAKISGNSVDIRKVKTSIASLTFDLLDKGQVISAFLMAKDDNYLEKDVEIFAGWHNKSFDFSEYKKFTKTKLKTITKGDNRYSFNASEITSIIKQNAFFNESQLDGTITDSQTTLDVVNAEDFPASGRIKINDEYIIYSSKTTNTLNGLSRGDLSSAASEHDSGDLVSIVTEIEDNPIDIMLDVMQNTLSIPTLDIDVTSFTDIRDTFFQLDEFRFYLTGVDDVLEFFEDEILQVINCRMTSIDGLIGLAILDQTDFKTQPRELAEKDIVGTPPWKIGSDKVVNEIEIEWGYNEGLKTFSRISRFDDSDSQTKFNKKKTLKYQFKGVKSDLDGSTIVTNMGARLLARTKNTQADIKVTSFFNNSDLKIGEDVAVTHRFLPQQGGGLGMSDQRLEIMSKAFDFDNKRVKFSLQFTSFSNLRVGLIAPSPFIVSVIDQKTFTVPIGSQYKAGYFLRLWNTTSNDYYTDTAIEIESVVGNTITMKSDFTTTLTTSVKVKFPVYSESSSVQVGKYAYTCPNSGFFNDTTKCYEIIF